MINWIYTIYVFNVWTKQYRQKKQPEWIHIHSGLFTYGNLYIILMWRKQNNVFCYLFLLESFKKHTLSAIQPSYISFSPLPRILYHKFTRSSSKVIPFSTSLHFFCSQSTQWNKKTFCRKFHLSQPPFIVSALLYCGFKPSFSLLQRTAYHRKA